MSLPSVFAARLRNLFIRNRLDRELDDEVRFHVEMQTEDNLRAGMSPSEAHHAAIRSFGGVERMKEEYREWRTVTAIETIGQDMGYALRTMRRNPIFCLTVIVTLALGIGANTAIFSVVHAAITPLGIWEPDRVVMVWTDIPQRNFHALPASIPDFLDWKTNGVFSSLGGMLENGFSLRVAGRTERINGLNVTKDFLDTFGQHPQLGRLFTEQDMQAGHDHVVILSDDLWRSHFAAEPSVIGASIVLNGAPQTVVGVLPKRFPKLGHEDVYAPLILAPPLDISRRSRSLVVVGRLAPGFDVPAAQKRMADLSLRMAKQYQDDVGSSVRLQPVAEAFVEDAQALLTVLLGAVGFVLLIACANIANLLLARGMVRGREMAIRTALGANRWRLCRQLMAENVLLAMLGGALAVIPGLWGTKFISSFHLNELPNPDLIAMNSSVLGFNFVLALATGIVFGLAPVLQIWKADVHTALKSTGRANAGSPRQRLRGLFVVSEIALTLVLLVSAGLMVTSFLRLRSLYPGFEVRGAVTMTIAISGQRYETGVQRVGFFKQVVQRAGALPGVIDASATEELPGSDNVHASGLVLADRPTPRLEDVPVVLRTCVMNGYFRAMRTPLLRGRYFNDGDRENSRLVVIVDDWTAKRYWPNEDPVGKQLKLGMTQPTREVVGVVGNMDQGVIVKLMRGQIGQAYLPFAQEPKASMTVVLRSTGDTGAVVAALRDIVRGVDGDQPIFHVRTLETVRAEARGSQRLATWLLAGFAAIALLLATIGIYGLMAYNVGQRTREFGIRMSLGASRSDVLRLVVREGIVLAGTGILAGLAGALALTRLMSTLLYRINAIDPVTFVGVTGLLAAVALLACYIPARRATMIDPAIVLRYE
jgi:predicted permease